MALLASTASLTSTNRVIALVDMDCFYVQVEERDDPSIKGVPAAVVQYKAYKGGGIIAVNYEARAKGVSRNMRGDDAKAVCPEIQLVRVPETRGKADLTKYRDAGREVIHVLTDFSSCVERASIDEAYIDLTEAVETRLAELSSQEPFSSWGESILKSLDMECFSTNYVLGHESTTTWFDAMKDSEVPSIDDIKLAIGAEIVGKMREAVYQRTNFRCSAGIAHNKVLAKLVCGINKPNKQTVLPHSSVSLLWSTTKIGKVRGLGGKLGDYITEKMGCVHMSDLCKFSAKELNSELGAKTGVWLHELSLGYDDETVTPRQLPKSIGCNKNFSGPEALKTKDKVKFWIHQLAAEVVERIQKDLETNNRRAKTLTLHVRIEDQNSLSRSCGAPQYNAERMAADAYAVMEKLYQSLGVVPVCSLGLIASKFEDEVDISGCAKINAFFKTKSDSNGLRDGEVSSSVPEKEKSSKASSSSSKGTIKSYFTSATATSNSDPLPLSTLPVPSKACRSNSESEITVITPNKSIPSELEVLSSRTCDAVSSNVDRMANGVIMTDNAVKNGIMRTPTKQHPSSDEPKTDAQHRKAFFSFSETVPKVSPVKSPRKTIPVPIASTSTASSSNDTTHNDFECVTFKKEVEKECERCGKKVNAWEYGSHMDYHFAKDLSREINGLPPLNFDIRSETQHKVKAESVQERATQKRPRGRGSAVSGSKRGRGAKSVSSSSKATSKTLDSYFGNNNG